MSVFHDQTIPPAVDPAVEGSNGPKTPTISSLLATDTASSSKSKSSLLPALDPHRQARELVRLVQCSRCSLPLQEPLTLPCGNSLCRKCLPQTHVRGLGYVFTLSSGRDRFDCPFQHCGKEHVLADCALDVTLSKIMDRVASVLPEHRRLAVGTPTLLDERPHWRNIVDSSKDERIPSSQILDGGRLLATFTLAERGLLRYDSEVAYQTMSPNSDTYEYLDINLLKSLRDASKVELDCQVCYGLLLDPLTTACGHTFCRRCVARILDHSFLCPICRRKLQMPPGVRSLPANVRLSKILLGFCPDHLAARAEAVQQEEGSMRGESNVPLFVCTLAYPAMPTFLHVFEPRYRLMMRRAMESADSKFGMMMYNPRYDPSGDPSQTQFMEYGTMLHINNLHMLRDGRSLIETRGVGRFKVRSWDVLDGYFVADVERVEDVSREQEERLELQAVQSAPTTITTSQEHTTIPQPWEVPLPSSQESAASATTSTATTSTTTTHASTNTTTDGTHPADNEEDHLPALQHLPNATLYSISQTFIQRMRARSAPWLSENYASLYGPPPAEHDAALFPYWFASVLPIAEAEKYKLLKTRSVRERLLITAEWVRKIECRRW